LWAAGKNSHHCSSEPLPVAAVRVQRVELKPHIATEDVIGTVHPRLQSVIEAKVSGQIEKMLVVPGQQVKTGEMLAQLNVREIQAKLDEALALQEQAQSDLKRYSILVEKRVITQQEFDAIQTRARVAKAAVIEAQTNLAYATINAPFDGVITRKLADVGDLASPGKPLVEMEDTKSLRLEADVPESIIGHVEMGARFGPCELKESKRKLKESMEPGIWLTGNRSALSHEARRRQTSSRSSWRGRADRTGLYRFEAHPAASRHISLTGISGDLAVATGRGAADQGADDRCAGLYAGIQREGSRGARYPSNGEAAMGNSRR
jgi:RND family efflux transporter MFP subunit